MRIILKSNASKSYVDLFNWIYSTTAVLCTCFVSMDCFRKSEKGALSSYFLDIKYSCFLFAFLYMVLFAMTLPLFQVNL